ncbi:hypothetical protein V8E55_008793 [Tylopilus felleus]
MTSTSMMFQSVNRSFFPPAKSQYRTSSKTLRLHIRFISTYAGVRTSSVDVERICARSMVSADIYMKTMKTDPHTTSIARVCGVERRGRNALSHCLDTSAVGLDSEEGFSFESGWTGLSIIQPRWKDFKFVNRPMAELVRYTIFSTVMVAVNFSLPPVPGVVNPNSPAGPIQIIIYCSVVWMTASILEAMGTLSPTKTGMAGLAITRSPDRLPRMVARCTNPPSHLFACYSQPATVATLSVEVLVIILLRVMRLFSQTTTGVTEMLLWIRTRIPLGRIRTVEQDSGNARIDGFRRTIAGSSFATWHSWSTSHHNVLCDHSKAMKALAKRIYVSLSFRGHEGYHHLNDLLDTRGLGFRVIGNIRGTGF